MKKRYIQKKNARFLYWGKTRQVFTSLDFSAVEDDANAFRIIRNLAAHAGKNAAAEAKALGLARVYVRDNGLVKVSVKGEAIAISPKISRPSFYVKYKPSTVLHVVKK